MGTEQRDAFRLYRSLIEPALLGLAVPDVTVQEAPGVLQVERGLILAATVLKSPSIELGQFVNPVIAAARSERLTAVRFVDAAGHSRSVYRPLFAYAWLQSYRLVYESLPRAEFSTWEEALRAFADLLEADLGSTAWPVESLAAGAGARWSEMAWEALALFVAGKVFVRDVWIDLASDTFGRLARFQQPNGGFLASTAADQPETLWYHELQILHALASYAVQAEDRPIAAAVAKATRFHQNETQPDHATTQPWGLFAFIWNADTRMLADQLLHSARIQHPEQIDGVSLMLHADCLYCLQLFEG